MKEQEIKIMMKVVLSEDHNLNNDLNRVEIPPLLYYFLWKSLVMNEFWSSSLVLLFHVSSRVV